MHSPGDSSQPVPIYIQCDISQQSIRERHSQPKAHGSRLVEKIGWQCHTFLGRCPCFLPLALHSRSQWPRRGFSTNKSQSHITKLSQVTTFRFAAACASKPPSTSYWAWSSQQPWVSEGASPSLLLWTLQRARVLGAEILRADVCPF